MTKSGIYTIAAQRSVPKIGGKAGAVPITSNAIQIRVVEQAPPTPTIRQSPSETAPANTQPAASPVTQWKIGDSWKMAVEWTNDKTQMTKNAAGKPEPMMLRYTAQATVTGEAVTDGKPVWQLDFVAGKDFPFETDRAFRVLVDKADGMARKSIELGGRKEERPAIGVLKVRWIGSLGLGLPTETLPFAEQKIEDPLKDGDGKVLENIVVTNTLQGNRRTVEMKIFMADALVDTVRQTWEKGASWWSEYSQEMGKTWVHARLVPDDRKWGKATEGVQISAQTESVAYAGEGVELNVALKNANSKALTLKGNSPETDFKITVKNERGEIMPPTEYGKSVVSGAPQDKTSKSLSVEQGKQAEYSVLVNRLYDMTQGGLYTITVERAVPKLAGGDAVTASDPVQVKVVEKPVPTDMSGGF